MNSEDDMWRRSYEYLPFAAGEGDIAKADTSDLQAAHRLMEPCNKKPPSTEIEISAHSLFTDDTYRSLIDTWILDEHLRVARVCRELGGRLESDRLSYPAPRPARSSLLGGCSRMSHDWPS